MGEYRFRSTPCFLSLFRSVCRAGFDLVLPKYGLLPSSASVPFCFACTCFVHVYELASGVTNVESMA